MSIASAGNESQLDLFRRDEPSAQDSILSSLPSLPKSVKYYCAFDNKKFTILNFDTNQSISASVNGAANRIELGGITEFHRKIIKHLFVFILSADKSIGTAMLSASGFRQFSEDEVVRMIGAGPTGIQSVWVNLLSRGLASNAYPAAKSLLSLCCRYRVGDWSDMYVDFLSAALPLPFHDKFVTVKSGDAFLTGEEESNIIRHLDRLSHEVKLLRELPSKKLADSAMLLCAYQFGMRPIQIAMLSFGDIKVWPGDSQEIHSVHLTFQMVKQRTTVKLKPLQRKVKYEWAPIFIELYERARKSGAIADTRIFDAASSREAGGRIAELVSSLVGRDVSTTDLRHTAAQRLVDAGASQEELAEFLGHTDITTGLVYFRASANQAELVNRALGASEIYQRVARIAHDRFIDADELAHLKGEQQIGGMPHGIPIAGIGGCSSGQPACPYNPIMSCYGCRKFMPLHEVGIHEQVLTDFREVVRFFHDSSRGDQHSPAYLQLQRTIAEVQAVIAEIKAGIE